MLDICSPLTGSPNVILEKEIRCDWLIANYQQQLGMDVRKYFADLEVIQVYKCLDTGYRFYYPFHLEGDGAFYEELQKFSWYYTDWKWEHQIANRFVEPAHKVLEIGCGQGAFLNRLSERVTDVTGLELNRKAASEARAHNLKILDQTIESHVYDYPEHYDVVCSFQVVEHIGAIQPFMQASINVLKKGGLLIFSVPHNYPSSPILEKNILDMPPHHSGLWDSVALANLQNVFPLKLEQLLWEPLQKSHRGIYGDVVHTAFNKNLGLRGKLANKIFPWIQQRTIQYLSDYLLGHTIFVQYRKLG